LRGDGVSNNIEPISDRAEEVYGALLKLLISKGSGSICVIRVEEDAQVIFLSQASLHLAHHFNNYPIYLIWNNSK
jgi:hypothetical protein